MGSSRLPERSNGMKEVVSWWNRYSGQIPGAGNMVIKMFNGRRLTPVQDAGDRTPLDGLP